jgi:hypothetical protein
MFKFIGHFTGWNFAGAPWRQMTLNSVSVFRILPAKIRGQHINFYSRVVHTAKIVMVDGVFHRLMHRNIRPVPPVKICVVHRIIRLANQYPAPDRWVFPMAEPPANDMASN